MAPERALVARFRAALEELGASLHEAASLERARVAAAGLVGEATVARWADEELDGIAAPGREAPAAEAEVSLVLAAAGVAATGAVVLAHGAGRSRAAGVLPTRQVVLLHAADLVPELGDALARVGLGGGSAGEAPPPASVVLVAGPSRTSDIEQRSIRGVHAPRAVAVVIFPR